MLIVLINVAYVLMVSGFMARDVLYLRSLLILAQIGIGTYAWFSGVPLITAWNVVIASINVFMVIQIVRERRAIELPAGLQGLHTRHFSAMSPAEFLRWWQSGTRTQLAQGQQLAQEGTHPDWLYFVLEGTVRVSRHGEPVVELPAGYFVAEMSLISAAPANADVHAVGTVETQRWSTRDLQGLRQRNPALWSKLQAVLGHNLIEKIRFGESASRPTHP